MCYYHDVEIRKPLDGNICIQRIDHYTMCQVPTHTVATLTPGKYHLPPYLICKECEFVVKQKFLELVRVLHYYRKHHYV